MDPALVPIDDEHGNKTDLDMRKQLDAIETREDGHKYLSGNAPALQAKRKTVNLFAIVLVFWTARIIFTLANVQIIIWFPVLVQHRVHRGVNPRLPVDWDLVVPVGLKNDYATDGFTGC